MCEGQVSILSHAAEEPAAEPSTFLCTYLRKYGGKLVKERGLEREDARTLCMELQRIRGASGRCGHGVSVFVAFWGYDDVKSSNTLLRGLRYALRPRVIFASHKKQSAAGERSTYFEGVVFYQPHVASMHVLEALLDGFRMSLGTADLDTLMTDAMVTCLGRITGGDYRYGNWETVQNTFYRAHFERVRAQKEEREARENAFAVTGMHTTTSNHLALFYGRQNLQIELTAANMHSRGALHIALRDESLISDALALSIVLEGEQQGTSGQLMRQRMTDILDRNLAMQDALRAIVHSTRAVTVINLT